MKERGIIFNAENVRAILDGRKTQTRRAVRDQEYLLKMDRSSSYGPLTVRNSTTPGIFRWDCRPGSGGSVGVHKCPYGFTGDRLWVKETHVFETWEDEPKQPTDRPIFHHEGDRSEWDQPYWLWPHYRATDPEPELYYEDDPNGGDGPMCKWRPSIFMPRWASRITLEIINVRVERLQEISRDDARAEGVSNIWDWNAERYEKHPEHFSRGVLNPYVANYSVLWDEINGAGAWDLNPWIWVIEFRKLAEKENNILDK